MPCHFSFLFSNEIYVGVPFVGEHLVNWTTAVQETMWESYQQRQRRQEIKSFYCYIPVIKTTLLYIFWGEQMAAPPNHAQKTRNNTRKRQKYLGNKWIHCELWMPHLVWPLCIVHYHRKNLPTYEKKAFGPNYSKSIRSPFEELESILEWMWYG